VVSATSSSVVDLYIVNGVITPYSIFILNSSWNDLCSLLAETSDPVRCEGCPVLHIFAFCFKLRFQQVFFWFVHCTSSQTVPNHVILSYVNIEFWIEGHFMVTFRCWYLRDMMAVPHLKISFIFSYFPAFDFSSNEHAWVRLHCWAKFSSYTTPPILYSFSLSLDQQALLIGISLNWLQNHV
jgi:hypothetical protein